MKTQLILPAVLLICCLQVSAWGQTDEPDSASEDSLAGQVGEISTEFLEKAGLADLVKVPNFRRSLEDEETTSTPPADDRPADDAAEPAGDTAELKDEYAALKAIATQLERFRQRRDAALQRVRLATTAIESATKRLKELEENAKSIKSDIDEAKAAVKTAGKEASDADAEVGRLETKLALQKKALNLSLRRSEQARLDTAVVLAKKIVAEKSTDYASLQKEVLELQAYADDAVKTVADAQNAVVRLTREKDLLSQKVAQREDLIARLKAAGAQLKKTGDDFNDSDVDAVAGQLRSVVVKKSKEVEPAQKQLTAKAQEIEDAQQDLAEAKRAAQEKDKLLAAGRQRLAQSKASLDAAKKDLSAVALAAAKAADGLESEESSGNSRSPSDGG